MRRLVLTLLVATAVIPAAAFAAGTAAGDGVFELNSVNGVVVLTGRGVLWGQMDRGVMKVTDPDPTDGQQPLVSGAEHTRPAGDNVTLYWGSNLHFRLTGGKYKIRFKGTGIDLTAVGVGSADMTGDPLALDRGDYAVDGGKWASVPVIERVVQYPAQPGPAQTTTGP